MFYTAGYRDTGHVTWHPVPWADHPAAPTSITTIRNDDELTGPGGGCHARFYVQRLSIC